MSRCGNLSVMNRSKSAALIALTVVLGVGACGSSKTGTDAAAGAGGGGSHGGAGGSSGGAGGSSGGTGGSSAGTGGQAGGGGGQQDAGSCRMYGQSCGASQPCCVPMICAGGCTMPVSQDASSDGLGLWRTSAAATGATGGACQGTLAPPSGRPAGSGCGGEHRRHAVRAVASSCAANHDLRVTARSVVNCASATGIVLRRCAGQLLGNADLQLASPSPSASRAVQADGRLHAPLIHAAFRAADETACAIARPSIAASRMVRQVQHLS